jgi:3-phenylpropionate/trans-cinnamate dioxygenase ferredoxin reductase component
MARARGYPPTLVQWRASMPDRSVDHLIIGGGIAATSCARTLRESGATGPILVVSREVDQPYHRPPVTKQYLRGDIQRTDIVLEPASWWAQAGVELMTRMSVTELDTGARTAKLQSGETVGFGTALVATGALVRRLSVDGSHLEGMHYLRTPGNADSLRRDIRGAEDVVVVGGSYVACETAATLASRGGSQVTMLMLERHPLMGSFGAVVGQWFRNVLQRHRVTVVGGVKVQEIEGHERVRSVLCSDGSSYRADAVVCGVGALPDVMLARKAGLELGELGGVLCNSRLETSAPGVYAAGDMCEFPSVVHDGEVMRIEHEQVAADQGATVARNMLGAGQDHATVPYFFSDLSDWVSLEYVGPARTWDEEVVRGSLEAGSFSVWYLEAGRLRGVLGVDREADVRRGSELIAAHATMTAADIAAAA